MKRKVAKALGLGLLLSLAFLGSINGQEEASLTWRMPLNTRIQDKETSKEVNLFDLAMSLQKGVQEEGVASQDFHQLKGLDLLERNYLLQRAGFNLKGIGHPVLLPKQEEKDKDFVDLSIQLDQTKVNPTTGKRRNFTLDNRAKMFQNLVKDGNLDPSRLGFLKDLDSLELEYVLRQAGYTLDLSQDQVADSVLEPSHIYLNWKE